MHPFDQVAPIIREVQGEIQHAFSILVPRETEELSAGGGSLNREDAPLLYASRKYSYNLNRKGKPEPNISVNLTLMAEELERRKVRLVKDNSDIPAELKQGIIGEVEALPNVAIIAVFEFWRFMQGDEYLRMCNNCPQFFITGDGRKFYCSPKCSKNSRKSYMAKRDRERTKLKLLESIESYGVKRFLEEYERDEREGIKSEGKTVKSLIFRARKNKLTPTELRKILNERARKGYLEALRSSISS